MSLLKASTIFMNPKGWIEVIWGNIIHQDEYISIGQNMFSMVASMKDNAQDPLMLINFTDLEVVTPAAATIAASTTKDLGCKKIAGFGIKPQFKEILDMIKKNSTREDSIREFESRQPAEIWLLTK